MASRSSACPVVLLLVLAFAHVMAAAAPTTTDVSAEAPGYDEGLLSRKYDLLAPASCETIPKAVAGCMKTVLKTSSPCARDVLLSLVFGSVHLSQGCCAVLSGVGEKCVADVFSAVPRLGPALLPVMNRICGFVAAIT